MNGPPRYIREDPMAEKSLKLDRIAGLGLLRKQTPGPGGVAPQAQNAPQVPETPELGDKVELIGEMRESAFKDPQWLISRDKRFIQVSPLIFRIAEQIDGQRTLAQIAQEASRGYEREITAEEVRDFIATALIPAAIVKLPDGSAVQQATAGPSALQVNLKMQMFPPALINVATGVLKTFYFPPVLIAMLAVAFATQYWVFAVHGIGQGLFESFNTPGMLAALLGVIIASAAFHEFGHASGLTYGGGQVGAMGAGLYIVYPALYTDVTDNYRLGRWARVRTDLGGFYFNLIFGVFLTGLYALTGEDFLLVAIAAIDIEIVHQMLPFIRLDGYWALADITGIPDFFSQIVPFLRSVLPSWAPLPKGRELPALKTWAKVFFAVYIIVVIPFLLAVFFLMFRALPRIIATAATAFWDQATQLPEKASNGEVLLVLAMLVQMLLILLPGIGAVLMFFRLGRKFVTGVWHWGDGSASKRGVSAVAIAGMAGLFIMLWLPQMNLGGVKTSGPVLAKTTNPFRPIQPGERLNVSDAATSRVIIANPPAPASQNDVSPPASNDGKHTPAGSQDGSTNQQPGGENSGGQPNGQNGQRSAPGGQQPGGQPAPGSSQQGQPHVTPNAPAVGTSPSTAQTPLAQPTAAPQPTRPAATPPPATPAVVSTPAPPAVERTPGP